MIRPHDLPAMVRRFAQHIIDAPRGITATLPAAGNVRLSEPKLKHIVTMIDTGRSSEAVLAESIAFDLAFVLVRGGGLPPPLYRLAGNVFGQKSVNDLLYIMGLQTMVAKSVRASPGAQPR